MRTHPLRKLVLASLVLASTLSGLLIKAADDPSLPPGAGHTFRFSYPDKTLGIQLAFNIEGGVWFKSNKMGNWLELSDEAANLMPYVKEVPKLIPFKGHFMTPLFTPSGEWVTIGFRDYTLILNDQGQFYKIPVSGNHIKAFYFFVKTKKQIEIVIHDEYGQIQKYLGKAYGGMRPDTPGYISGEIGWDSINQSYISPDDDPVYLDTSVSKPFDRNRSIKILVTQAQNLARSKNIKYIRINGSYYKNANDFLTALEFEMWREPGAIVDIVYDSKTAPPNFVSEILNLSNHIRPHHNLVETKSGSKVYLTTLNEELGAIGESVQVAELALCSRSLKDISNKHK